MTETMFVKYFGSTPFIRALDFFIDNHLFDYSKSDVSRYLDISRVTLQEVFGKLSRLKLIKQTRFVGKAKMYALHTENPVVKKMMKFDLQISTAASETEAHKTNAA